MAKPAGPSCNLRCKYCFYLEKKALFSGEKRCRMSDEVLEAYIRNTAVANMNSPGGILFAWQGGEPTLMGLDFFRRAVDLEKKYCAGHSFKNSFQTNGVLINEEWCEFFAKDNFFVGLSLDGPEFIHDHYRVDAGGQPTFKRVMAALKLLQKYGLEYNIMAAVSRESSKFPLEIYRFFKEIGVKFVQFSPIVERLPDQAACQMGLQLGMPPSLENKESGDVTPWTVEAEALGDFYIKIFDEWVRHDVAKMFVMNFEWALSNSLGMPGAVCTMARHCGNACIVEHNGDVYSCDHFVYPEFRLGNLLKEDVRALVDSSRQKEWGCRKESALPQQCEVCTVVSICRGGCPKHRFSETFNGEPGLNYLCSGYKDFYRHIAKYTTAFRTLLELNLPLENIMQAIDRPLMIPASEETGGQPVGLWIQ